MFIINPYIYATVESLSAFQYIPPYYTGQPTESFAGFGRGVAVNGNHGVFTAPSENQGGTNRGAAYMYELSGGSWVHTQKIAPSDPEDQDQFGYNVQINDNWCVVGAHLEDGSAGTEGAAYVFNKVGTAWVQTQKLTASDSSVNRAFGRSLSLDGDRLAVGGPMNTAAYGTGKVYMFDLSGSVWNETAIISGSNTIVGDLYGTSCDLYNDRLVVGARLANGDKGRAYVHELSAGNWTETAILDSSIGATDDTFGYSCSLYNDTIVIGAPQLTEAVNEYGYANIYTYNGVDWNELQTLSASTPSSNGHFGNDLDMYNERIVVSMPDGADSTGAVYVYDLSGSVYTETQVISGNNSHGAEEVGDRFSTGVAYDGTHMFVGAYTSNVAQTAGGVGYIYEN